MVAAAPRGRRGRAPGLGAGRGPARATDGQERATHAETQAPRAVITEARKPWEKQPCKPNSKPIRVPMHVRLGDTVQVISGDDKGKVGEVVEVLTKKGKVVVRDVNMTYRTVPPRGEGEAGSVIRKESPVHHSKVMLYSTKEKVASRVGHKILDDGRKVRYLVKTGEVVEAAERSRDEESADDEAKDE